MKNNRLELGDHLVSLEGCYDYYMIDPRPGEVFVVEKIHYDQVVVLDQKGTKWFMGNRYSEVESEGFSLVCPLTPLGGRNE